MADPLERKKELRATFMRRLYEETNGHSRARTSMWHIGEGLSFTRDETDGVTEYLQKEGLVEFKGAGGQISITHEGVKEIEEALQSPDQPTLHFPPINIINVHQMTNSQIQQGSPKAVQNLEVAVDIQGVRELLEILRAHDGAIAALAPEIAAEANAEIATIEAQAASPKPKTVVLLGALKSLKTILEGAAGGLLGSLALPKVITLIAALSQQADS